MRKRRFRFRRAQILGSGAGVRGSGGAKARMRKRRFRSRSTQILGAGAGVRRRGGAKGAALTNKKNNVCFR